MVACYCREITWIGMDCTTVQKIAAAVLLLLPRSAVYSREILPLWPPKTAMIWIQETVTSAAHCSGGCLAHAITPGHMWLNSGRSFIKKWLTGQSGRGILAWGHASENQQDTLSTSTMALQRMLSWIGSVHLSPFQYLLVIRRRPSNVQIGLYLSPSQEAGLGFRRR